MNRIIEEIKGEEDGKEVIIIAGMHGNELAGLRAVENITAFIKENNIAVKGNITALKGNIKAINKESRYIDVDLNRLWTDDYINSNGTYSNWHEISELKELNAEIEKRCKGNYKNCVILDFHSFTADSGIFAIPADSPESVELAKQYQVQFIEQLTSNLKETAIQYFAFKGVTAVVFEGGQHYAPETQENIETAAFIALNYLGSVDKKDIPNFDIRKQKLKDKAGDLPTHYKLAYIHRIPQGADFKMNPGYVNFQNIKKGEILAYQDNEAIRANTDGSMLMPLYQKQGSNGFYIIKEFKNQT